MAVQVDPTFVHAAPATKRVVTEHQRCTLGLDLDIRLDTLPAVELGRRRWIVVAGDEVLAAAKPSQELSNDGQALANGKIAKVPHFVIRPDRLIPPFDEAFVHCRDRGERPAVKPQRAAMAKMRVAGEEDGHAIQRCSCERNEQQRQVEHSSAGMGKIIGATETRLMAAFADMIESVKVPPRRKRKK